MYNLLTWHLDNVRAGEIIRQFKDECGFTTDYIEEKLGISSPTLKNIYKGQGVITLERAIKLCALFEIPIISVVALLVEGVNITFADKILTYNPATGTAVPITNKGVAPIRDTIPDEIAEAAMAVTSTPAIVPPMDTVNRVSEQHIEDLRAEIVRQDATIRQLLDILAKR